MSEETEAPAAEPVRDEAAPEEAPEPEAPASPVTVRVTEAGRVANGTPPRIERPDEAYFAVGDTVTVPAESAAELIARGLAEAIQ